MKKFSKHINTIHNEKNEKILKKLLKLSYNNDIIYGQC